MNKKRYNASELDKLEKRFRAEFINCLSGFKSANLIGTRSQQGIDNLSIVSSVVHIGAHPPLLGMIMRPHTVQRDTLENIKQTGVYTINHVTSKWIAQAHHTSARFSPDISEFDSVGLTPINSTAVNAPYVEQSVIQLSLEVQDIQYIAINQTELVIGQIVEVILPEDSIDETGYIDIEACDSICISGLVSYHATERIGRYAYAKPDTVPVNTLKK